MSLVRTSLLNGIAVIVRMLSLLGINKLLAIYVGPSGFAVVGQFQNVIQIISTFASSAVNTGVIRYTSEYNENQKMQVSVWKTAGSIALINSLLTSLVIVVSKDVLSNDVLKIKNYDGVFLWFAFGLVFYVLNIFFTGILNGKKELRKFVLANITGSILALVCTFFLGLYFNLYGVLVALGIYQSVAFFSTVAICSKSDWFKLKNLFGRPDPQIVKKLFGYTLMAMSSAIFIPAGHILIRNHLSANLGLTSAGHWEAMWRLSSAYLLVITSTLGVYYLPRLSELKSSKEIKREVYYCFRIIVPFTIACSSIIYLARDFIIGLLFTADFKPVRDLFFWQMIGDTVKIASWLLGYIFSAKGFVYLYVLSEFLFSALFYLLVVLLLPRFGLESTAMAHLINYIFYFQFVFYTLKLKKIL